jgi:TolA-binding protein
MRFLRGNVLFADARYAEAEKEFQTLLKDSPKSAHAEEVEYRLALVALYQKDEANTEKRLRHYIQSYPKGPYVTDARYRLAFITFGDDTTLETAKAVIADLQQLEKDAPNDANFAQVHCLTGDAFCRLAEFEPEQIAKHHQAAKAAYERAIKAASTDEVRDYATTNSKALK